MALRFVSKSTFAPEEITASDQLEPALESLLRSMKVNDSVINWMRVNEILDRAVFVDLAQDEDKMRKCTAAFGIDQSDQADFLRQSEMTKLLGAWRQARTQREVKLIVDATAKAHGEPVSMLAMDWNSLDDPIQSQIWCWTSVQRKTCFEAFEELRSECKFEAERLSEVVSQEEADMQRRSKPDPARQYDMHLDGRLTLQARRRFKSTEPRDIEQLRAKYTVMENLWLLAQMHQPGRSIYNDLTPSTFSNVP